MFGIGGGRDRKLRRGGQTAMATVLSIRRQKWAMYMIADTDVNPNAAGQEPKARWKMTVRVDRPDRPAFDATLHAWLGTRSRPSEGWLVPVLYDQGDHSRVLLDTSAAARQAAAQANAARLAAQTSEADAETTVDRLTKLIEQRDRGELTAAEYEAGRQKLLGQ